MTQRDQAAQMTLPAADALLRSLVNSELAPTPTLPTGWAEELERS